MEFQDRKSTYPGRITLRHLDKNGSVTSEETCEIVFADQPTAEGTPLNASTFNQLIADIMSKVTNVQGPKGDKGERGAQGASGTNSAYITSITVTKV